MKYLCCTYQIFFYFYFIFAGKKIIQLRQGGFTKMLLKTDHLLVETHHPFGMFIVIVNI